MRTLVFLPTYNERGNIKELIEEILKLGPEFDILVVDDSSSDGTAEILDTISQSNDRVLVVHRSGKRGRGISGREGFKLALKEKPDYVIEMDADFSHDPKYIPLFLKEVTDCDVVIGSRFIKDGSVSGRSWQRNYISLLAQVFSRMLLGLDILDATSGYRCFKRYVLESLDFDAFLSNGPAIVGELNYHIQKKGFKFKEIPIVFQERKSGHSKLNPSKLFRVLWTLAKVRFS